MQLIKPLGLSLTSRCFGFRKRNRLSISAMVYFPFTGDGPAVVWSEPGLWQFLGKEMPVPMIDEGIVKLRPEFLVHGHAFAPGGAAEACAVRARVGAREKTLLAFGNRYWDGDSATPPTSFARVPLDWQHAYGGPDFPPNPVGRGRTLQSINGVRVQRLPNIEDPAQRLTGPRKEVAPAGFGRIDPTWPQRSRYRGTYDASWVTAHAPDMAPDTQWRHFNFAPEDQQFDEPLQGDEAFEFENLHPDKPLVSGRLPGLQVRTYCSRRIPEGGQKISEIQMQLTTLWFFPHAERGVLLFHGQIEVTEPDASDVSLLMAAVERTSEPRGDDHYMTVLEQRLDPENGHLYALRDSDLMPTGITGRDPEFEAMTEDYKVEGLMGQAQRRRAELQVELIRDDVRAAGMDPDALNIRMPEPEPIPTIEELPAYVEKKWTLAQEEQRKALLDAAEKIVSAEKTAAAGGLNLAAAEHRGPPSFNADAVIAELRAMAAPVDIDKIGPKLQQVEVVERFNYLRAAHLQPPALPLNPEIGNPLRTRVREAKAAGMNYRGGNFTGADLSGLDLSGTDFEHAWLEGVNFAGANLERAKFDFAVLAHADLTDANAKGASFKAANLGRAQIAGANFDHADLTSAVLSGVDFSSASFQVATLVGTELLDARYGPCRWVHAQVGAAIFNEAKLEGMVFDGANLADAQFIACDLTGTSFAHCNLAGATFIGCKAPGVSFAGADLTRAVFVKECVLDQADFSGAVLKGANCRGASMKGVSLVGANLQSIDLSDAVLAGADLTDADAAEALVMKADLSHAMAHGANFKDAILQRSDIRGTDFSGSNFFGCDLSLTHADMTTNFRRCYTVRWRTHPRRPAANAT